MIQLFYTNIYIIALLFYNSRLENWRRPLIRKYFYFRYFLGLLIRKYFYFWFGLSH